MLRVHPTKIPRAPFLGGRSGIGLSPSIQLESPGAFRAVRVTNYQSIATGPYRVKDDTCFGQPRHTLKSLVGKAGAIGAGRLSNCELYQATRRTSNLTSGAGCLHTGATSVTP